MTQWSTVTMETNIVVPVTASYLLYSTNLSMAMSRAESPHERKGKQFPDLETKDRCGINKHQLRSNTSF